MYEEEIAPGEFKEYREPQPAYAVYEKDEAVFLVEKKDPPGVLPATEIQSGSIGPAAEGRSCGLRLLRLRVMVRHGIRGLRPCPPENGNIESKIRQSYVYFPFSGTLHL